MLRLPLKSEKLQVILNFVNVLHHDYNGRRCDWVKKQRVFSVYLGTFANPSCSASLETLALHLSWKLRCMFVCSNLMLRFLHAVKADLATECWPLLLLSLSTQRKIAANFNILMQGSLLATEHKDRAGYNFTSDHCGNKPRSLSVLRIWELCGETLSTLLLQG